MMNKNQQGAKLKKKEGLSGDTDSLYRLNCQINAELRVKNHSISYLKQNN